MIKIDDIEIKHMDYLNTVNISFVGESILNLNYYGDDETITLENLSGDDDSGLLDLDHTKRLKIIGVDEGLL